LAGRREVGGLGASQDLVHVGCCAAIALDEAGSIRHEPTCVGESARDRDGGQPSREAKLGHGLERQTRLHDEGLRCCLLKFGECVAERCRIWNGQRLEFDVEGPGGALGVREERLCQRVALVREAQRLSSEALQGADFPGTKW
jgi:hypothetical protein